MNESDLNVQMIPIDQINVINPRSRNKVVFQSIVSNISNVGLKKPITVAPRSQPINGRSYDLVCGQGRLEAYSALGATDIPAIVVEATREDCFLMSLVENIARRQHSPVELLREISNLKTRGYNTTEIAKKIDLAKSYVSGISHLLDHGEDRLLAAVEKGRIRSRCKLPTRTRQECSASSAKPMKTKHFGAGSCSPCAGSLSNAKAKASN